MKYSRPTIRTIMRMVLIMGLTPAAAASEDRKLTIGKNSFLFDIFIIIASFSQIARRN
jgi:hypothetical protein